MAKKDKKQQQRRFHFKLAKIMPGQGKDFKTLVAEAYKATAAVDRRFEIETDSDRYRVLNSLEELGRDKDAWAASVFAFTMDANMNAAEVSAHGKSYPISVFAPPRDAKKRLEFVEGLIWIAALRDYVAIMANRAISNKVLEEYFSWAIGRHLGSTVSVAFVDPEKPSLRGYDMTKVKSMVIDNNIDIGEQRKTEKSVGQYAVKGSGWDVLKSVFKSLGREPPDLTLARGETLDRLKVSVIIKAVMQGNYASSAKIVTKIAEAFRDLDDPPVSFEFSDGRSLKLGDLRIGQTMRVTCINDLPDAYETQKKLEAWLRSQVTAIENPRG